MFIKVEKLLLTLPRGIQEIYAHVDNRITSHDHTNSVQNLRHYFGVGSSAISVIQSGSTISGSQTPRDILDFACGAGRVTRWLKVAFPSAHLVSCDLRDLDLAFQKEIFGVETWSVTASFDDLIAPRSFDLIWVGSLLSHLSDVDARATMSAFMRRLNPGGLLVVTFHGRRVLLGKTMRGAKYISDTKFERVERASLERGFGYEDSDNQKGLGFSIIKPQWFFEFAAPKTI